MDYRNSLHQEIFLHMNTLPVFRFGVLYLAWYIMFCFIAIGLTLVYYLVY